MEEYVNVHQYNSLLTRASLPDINLSELQKTLDTQGIEVVESQKESVVGRKALADKTKGRGIYRPSVTRAPILG
jgi:hypothetical protein